MKRWNYWADAALVAALILALTGAIVLGSTIASAQDENETATPTETPTQTPTETPTPTDDPVDEVADEVTGDDEETPTNATDELRPNKYQQEIDDSLRLVRAEWGEDELRIFVESDIPGRSITISDGAMMSRIIEGADGSGRAPAYPETLDKGVNEIVVPIERYNGLGLIFIAPPNAENTIYVKEDRSNPLFRGDFTSGEARLIGITAASLGSVGMVAFVWWRRKKLAKTVKKV